MYKKLVYIHFDEDNLRELIHKTAHHVFPPTKTWTSENVLK